MMKEIFELCVQGTINEAYDRLQQHAAESEEHQFWLDQYTNSFFNDAPDTETKHEDSWIESVLMAYNRYFKNVLTNKLMANVAEEELLTALNQLLPSSTICEDLNTVEQKLKDIFVQKGYHFLGGRTLPHYGPYIWKDTETIDYQVELPHETERVKVHFLDHFIMRSWLYYATFGHLSTGGWADHTGLYCVKDRYQHSLEGPEFQLSFLKHEAQHFNDYKHFPKLQAADLEYRAKLIELHYAPNTDIIKRLCNQAAPLPANPHAYSSYIILKQFSNHFLGQDLMLKAENWDDINSLESRIFAKKLLDVHTYQLHEQGASIVETVI